MNGLRNHRAFQEDLARELRRRARLRGRLALVMLDLDGLKAINDTGGHQAGDGRLQALGGTLTEAFRGGDCAYRVQPAAAGPDAARDVEHVNSLTNASTAPAIPTGSPARTFPSNRGSS